MKLIYCRTLSYALFCMFPYFQSDGGLEEGKVIGGGGKSEEVAEEKDEDPDMICLRVKDVLGITGMSGPNSTQTLLYNPTATFGQVVNDVAAKFGMAVGEFELVYQARMDLVRRFRLKKITGVSNKKCIIVF